MRRKSKESDNSRKIEERLHKVGVATHPNSRPSRVSKSRVKPKTKVYTHGSAGVRDIHYPCLFSNLKILLNLHIRRMIILYLVTPGLWRDRLGRLR